MKRILTIFLLLFAQIRADTAVINAFSKGELSPYLRGRTDVKAYYAGCETLENVIILSQGGVTKRPGSYYIAKTKISANVVRLISFEYSTEQAYIIEMGNEYFRFYKDGGQIQSDDLPYEISTPYLTADLFEIQYIQSADTMYLVHPNYVPRILTRTGHISWTLTTETFIRGPFKDENITETTITPSAKTGSIILEASTEIWNSNHVGGLWKITHTVEADEVAGNLNEVENSATTPVQMGRKFDWTTHGNWKGTAILQRSYDDGTVWKDVIPFNNNDDGNISYSDRETVDDAIYRVRMNSYTSGTCKYNLTVHSFDVDGVVQLTSITDADTVVGTVTYDLGDTIATKYWAEGAFSVDEGYPGTVAFFEERIVYAGTNNQSQTLWYSQTDDWDNFLAGSNDTDAITLTIASDMVNSIRWLIPQNKLLIGTNGGEWTMAASSSDGTFTPTNVAAKRQSGFGSANIRAIMLNYRAVYVQRQLQKIRKMEYSFELDNWISPDLTILSEHITGDGVINIAMQRNPYPILWAVRKDGELLSLTLEESQQIVGWARHTFAGNVESVAVIPGATEDEVWISIKRTINNSVVRYIEQFQPLNFGTEQRDAFFINSGLTFDGGAAINITSITLGTPVLVLANLHGFSDGDKVRFADIIGTTELNNRVYTVHGIDTNTFTLNDVEDVGNIDGSGFTPYVSGGTVQQVEDTFTTLSHLERETITIMGDGAYLGTDEVYNGKAVLTDFFNTVHIGLPYVAKIKPMKLEKVTNPGTIFGEIRRLHRIDIRFHETAACDVGTSWSDYDSFVFRDADDPLEAVTPLYTGIKSLEYAGDYENDTTLCIQSRLPVPFTILALKAVYEVAD